MNGAGAKLPNSGCYPCCYCVAAFGQPAAVCATCAAAATAAAVVVGVRATPWAGQGAMGLEVGFDGAAGALVLARVKRRCVLGLPHQTSH